MANSAIILAGGFSTRFGQGRALLQLGAKPLILRIVERIASVVDETLVTVNTEQQRNSMQGIVQQRAQVFVDEYKTQTPLAGAFTGFNHARNEYSLLLSCDIPFINTKIAKFLLETCIRKAASIPRWPEGHMEPLQAAYHTKSALEAAKRALDEEKRDMKAIVNHLRGVRFISTLVLQQLDPKLYTFFTINTQADLKKAENLLKTISSQ